MDKINKNVRIWRCGNCCFRAWLSGALLLSLCLPLTVYKVEAAGNTGEGFLNRANEGAVYLRNPEIEMNERDTVYFGSYWQEDTNGDGVADQRDQKTPIRWRILSKNGNDAYVIADKILDEKLYNEEDTDVTWETCTLRKWLNDDFYNAAFTDAEKEAVIGQTIVNRGQDYSGAEDEIITRDNVYLASEADMVNADYGFRSDGDFLDQARIGMATAYALEQRGSEYTEMGGHMWWLRSPRRSNYFASHIDVTGWVFAYNRENYYQYGYSDYVRDAKAGVRPVLHINISSPYVKTAGKEETSLKQVSWDLVEMGNYGDKPILWRVMDVTEDAVYLLSDQILENQKYNEELGDITWKDSSLRSWLNDSFYNQAFTDDEKNGILSYVYNVDNKLYRTSGGDDTEERVTLLSLDDIVKREYGFPTDYLCNHPARIAHGENKWWWLRSPGEDLSAASSVSSEGDVDAAEADVTNIAGVRPALHFSVSDLRTLKYAGTVSVSEDGTNTYTGSEQTNIIGCIPSSTGTAVQLASTEQATSDQQSSQWISTEQPTSGQPSGVQSASTQSYDLQQSTAQPVTEQASGIDQPTAVQPSTQKSASASAVEQQTGSNKNQAMVFNVKNKKTYKKSKKVVIRDADRIKTIKLNSKKLEKVSGKTKVSFKLSKYKKYLKKKGKWNTLTVTDMKGESRTIKFQVK